MTGRKWFRIAVIGCMCVIAGAGCRTKPKGATGTGLGGTDTLSPEKLEGDVGMTGARFGGAGEGTRITDSQLQAVHFAYDSFQVNDAEVSKIQQAADFMKSNPNVRLVAEGHCDERGSREYNLSLGEHRALAVRASLIGMGIEDSRIQSKSFGKEQPLDPGHDESAWSKNRRVEFGLYR
jgi:peptidoglycan-associated lipoprotein